MKPTFVLLAALCLAACQGHKVAAIPVEAAPTLAALAPPVASQGARSDEEAAAQVRANFARILFDFDSAVLDAEDQRLLLENADILRAHPKIAVTIEGHADQWGSDEYNLALGERRAEVVGRYLEDLGVHSGRLGRLSYGEERPVVGVGSVDDEAPNRRAEFTVSVDATAPAGS